MAIKVQGITVIDDGRNIINGIGASFTGIVTANTFVGSGASLTNISNTALTNNSVNYGGVTVSLGNTDATPAFDLSDATNYPYTSLTGISTEIVGDATPQLGGNLDLNSNNVTGTGDFNVTGVITATSFGGSGSALTGLTGASAATYGDASNVAQIVVDSNGRITGISEVTISGGGGGGGGINGITLREEGSVVGTSNSVQDINFVSDNLTASASGIGATITLSDTPTFTSTVIGSGVTINADGINVTGVVTATSFDGSLSSSDLDNSSVNYGGVTLALGGSDATPAFDLSDATAYPYTSLTGITTSIVGDTTPQLGGNLDLNSSDITGTGDVNITGVVTATSFSGSGSNLTSIPNSGLSNSSVSYGGVTLNLGDTDATPAFDLSDATDYPYTSLTGITTEIVGDTTPQLGGNLDLNSKFITGTGGINVSGVVTATTFSGSGASLTDIPNGALTNSSIAIGGVTLNLGDTDATPAFNLSDATAYPYTSLTGITTEILGDTTPQLGGNLDLNSKFITGTGGVNVTGVVTATSFVGSGVTVNSSGINVTGVVTATSFVGSGASLTNLPAPESAGDKYNTGITTSIYVSITGGIGTAQAGLTTVAANNDIFIGPGIAYSFPSTAGKSYVIESIHVTNIYNTQLYFTSRHDFNGGENVPTAQRVIVPYQGALEVLKEPIVAKPSDILRFQAFVGVGTTATGVDNGLDSFIIYSKSTYLYLNLITHIFYGNFKYHFYC